MIDGKMKVMLEVKCHGSVNVKVKDQPMSS